MRIDRSLCPQCSYPHLGPFIFPVLLWLALTGSFALADKGEVEELDPSLYEAELEPSVTLREHHNRVVEEYRVNNNLYMVKVTPTVGKSYYLVDEDGSGDMEMRRNAAGMDVRVPQWTLFSW